MSNSTSGTVESVESIDLDDLKITIRQIFLLI